MKVRNIDIGKGIPKICVPIIEETHSDVIAMAKKIYESSADIAEWRIDFYNGLNAINNVGGKSFVDIKSVDIDSFKETLKQLRTELGNKPLLITFRTLAEGGNKNISLENYMELIEKLVSFGYVDMVDVEVYRSGKEEISAFIKRLKKYVMVVGSYHDFSKTPDTNNMVERLLYMASVGADIPKLAVMPNNKTDVMRLMEASTEAVDKLSGKPVITMSMGKLGVISRIAAESTGSAVSFGCIGKPSAPGQIEAEVLKDIIERIKGI